MINFFKEFRKRVKEFYTQILKKKQAENQKNRMSAAMSMRYSKF